MLRIITVMIVNRHCNRVYFYCSGLVFDILFDWTHSTPVSSALLFSSAKGKRSQQALSI
jgi:hypothetical protein